MKKVFIEYNDKELWDVKMEGLITPRDLTRLIRAVKVQYRQYLRNQKLRLLEKNKKTKLVTTNTKGNLENGK